MKWRCLYILIMLFYIGVSSIADGFCQDARALVEESINYMRGTTSESTVTMTIHRPDWERTMKIKAWTKGRDESIFFILDPPKDKGNGTLKKKRDMWTYNPKVNRVIKLPPSMMSQSWMGSDFSNDDLSKTDSVIDDYTHTIIGTETHEGKTVYVIKSMPKPDAPVVWGMQKLKIRDDHIFLVQEFYDEDLQPVKVMTTLRIEMLGGKLFPKMWKMQKSGIENEYTIIEYDELAFDEPLPDRLFTQSALRTPPR